MYIHSAVEFLYSYYDIFKNLKIYLNKYQYCYYNKYPPTYILIFKDKYTIINKHE